MENDTMAIVYDDIIYSLQKSGGGSVYWTEIIKRKKNNVEHYAYDTAKKNFFYEEGNLPNLHVLSSVLLVIKRYLNLFFYKRDKPFIFHSSLYRLCNNKNAVNITTVHDFTYEYYRKDLKSYLHKIQKRKAVMHSDGVICISENTKKDLLKFYPNFKGRIKVIYNGYSTDKYYYKPEIKKTHNVLFVGARNDYKRFDFAVELLKELEECRLIIIGGGDLTLREKDMLDSKLHNRYDKKGYVSDEELCDLYNSSFFLCYPSEYEGFGIPLIEAQASGCPVVCQRNSSIPEVVADCAVYVNTTDLKKSIESIKQLYNSSYYTSIQKKGLENVKRFSWEQCAKSVFEFYEEVYLDVKKF